MQTIKSIRDSPCAALLCNWWDNWNIRENQTHLEYLFHYNTWPTLSWLAISLKFRDRFMHKRSFLEEKAHFFMKMYNHYKQEPLMIMKQQDAVWSSVCNETCLQIFDIQPCFYTLSKRKENSCKREKCQQAALARSLLKLLLMHFGFIKNTKVVLLKPIPSSKLLQYSSPFVSRPLVAFADKLLDNSALISLK